MSDATSYLGFTRPVNRRARITNLIMYGACIACAIVTLAALASILGYVLVRGISALSIAFFTHLPTEHPSGMRNSIAGTVILIVASSILGIPLGMLCGIYLAEFARHNPFTRAVRVTVDVLAGTPSIIVGVLAYQLVVKPTSTQSGYAGMVALAFMMIPIIAKTTEEMLLLVPKSYREASVGVGASRFQTLVRVILPSARAGIITGIMLAVARIAGETAPLYFTTGSSNLPVLEWNGWLPHIYFGEHYPTLTVQIFENATSSEPDWVNSAWAGMLVLIVMITVLNLAVRYVSRDKMTRS